MCTKLDQFGQLNFNCLQEPLGNKPEWKFHVPYHQGPNVNSSCFISSMLQNESERGVWCGFDARSQMFPSAANQDTLFPYSIMTSGGLPKPGPPLPCFQVPPSYVNRIDPFGRMT